LIFDAVGEETIPLDLKCVYHRGTIVFYGMASGKPDPIDPYFLYYGRSIRFAGGDDRPSTARTISIPVVPGTVGYAIGAPVGYGLARVTGPNAPSQTSTTITGRSTLTFHFGRLEVVTFSEVATSRWPGLPGGTVWSVTLTATGHGGPPTLTNSTTGLSVSFVIPKGAAYSFVVSVPTGYQGAGVHGHLTVPAHSLSKSVRFRAEGA